MLEERIQRTESMVKGAANISADQKTELLGLLARLKTALGKIENREDAEKIASHAEATVNEATAERKGQGALANLKRSVEKFEASHPELAETVNEFATLLANMGL